MNSILIVENRIPRLEKLLKLIGLTEEGLGEIEGLELVTVEYQKFVNILIEKKKKALDKYDLIIWHKSSIKAQEQRTLREYCSKSEKGLIFFSGEPDSERYDFEKRIYHTTPKALFSTNFETFIKNFISSQNHLLIALPKIVYGEMYDLSDLLIKRQKALYLDNKEFSEIEDLNVEISEKLV